jgi:peptidoglycan/xylan/chitin deacetylase (PgdA/CDA1 family)
VLKRLSRAALVGGLRQVARLPMTRKAIHRVSVASKGHAVVFFRCRRLLPDTARGKEHIDRHTGSALIPSELHKALRRAQRGLRFVHLSEALASLRSGERMDEAAAVLTFDESFAATAELALPVLKQLAIPATFFVSTGHLGGQRTLWDQEIHHLVQAHAPDPLSVPWIDRVMRTDTRTARATTVRRLLMILASLDEERLDARREELFDRVGGPPDLDPLDRMLTDVEVARLAEERLVTIGAHGHRHLPLGSISDAALDDELERPRGVLRELAGGAYQDVCSYAFGRHPYVDARAIRRARELGYLAGFGSTFGVVRPGDHLFRLPRVSLDKRGGAGQAYELGGLSAAVDQVLMLATGSESRVLAGLEG